jgi:hypothetical protein
MASNISPAYIERIENTAEPVTPIPVFYLHKGVHPFCRHPLCICHNNDRELEALLRGVIDRQLRLRQCINGEIH